MKRKTHVVCTGVGVGMGVGGWVKQRTMGATNPLGPPGGSRASFSCFLCPRPDFNTRAVTDVCLKAPNYTADALF